MIIGMPMMYELTTMKASEVCCGDYWAWDEDGLFSRIYAIEAVGEFLYLSDAPIDPDREDVRAEAVVWVLRPVG